MTFEATKTGIFILHLYHICRENPILNTEGIQKIISLLPAWPRVPDYEWAIARRNHCFATINNDAKELLSQYAYITLTAQIESKMLYVRELAASLTQDMINARKMYENINKKAVVIFDRPDAERSVTCDVYILDYYLRTVCEVFVKIQFDFPAWFNLPLVSVEGLFDYYCQYKDTGISEKDNQQEIVSNIKFPPQSPSRTNDNAPALVNNTIESTPNVQDKKRESKTNKTNKTSNKELQQPSFIAVKDDVRPLGKKVLSYKQLIVNPDHFSKIENEFFQNRIIDQNYNFINIRGKRKLLTQLITILKDRKYFKQEYLKKSGLISETLVADLIRFFECRYRMKFQKSFYKATNNKVAIQELIDDNYWVYKIPAC